MVSFILSKLLAIALHPLGLNMTLKKANKVQLSFPGSHILCLTLSFLVCLPFTLAVFGFLALALWSLALYKTSQIFRSVFCRWRIACSHCLINSYLPSEAFHISLSPSYKFTRICANLSMWLELFISRLLTSQTLLHVFPFITFSQDWETYQVHCGLEQLRKCTSR